MKEPQAHDCGSCYGLRLENAALRLLIAKAAAESKDRADPNKGGPFCENGLTYQTQCELFAAAQSKLPA